MRKLRLRKDVSEVGVQGMDATVLLWCCVVLGGCTPVLIPMRLLPSLGQGWGQGRWPRGHHVLQEPAICLHSTARGAVLILSLPQRALRVMTWVGRDLGAHPVPTPFHGQGHLQGHQTRLPQAPSTLALARRCPRSCWRSAVLGN